MAFKLKSPFHIESTLKKGGVAQRGNSGPRSDYNMFEGIDMAEVTEGDQEVKPEPTNNEVDRLANKADSGEPQGLNPKQEMKRKIKVDKKGIKDAEKEERQTESAKRMSQKYFGNTEGMTNEELDKKNFEEYKRKTDEKFQEYEDAAGNPELIDMLDEKHKRGKYAPDYKAPASKDYDGDGKADNAPIKPINKEEEMNKRYAEFKDNPEMTDALDQRYERGKYAKNTAPKNNFVMSREEKFINPILQMKGKPNRAGTPVRMLRSVEDKTPMKYKSVRKLGKDNLMSALAKQGEPVKKEMVNDFTMNMDDSTSLELPKPVKKMRPKKVDIKKSKSKGKSGEVTMDRKVSTKF